MHTARSGIPGGTFAFDPSAKLACHGVQRQADQTPVRLVSDNEHSDAFASGRSADLACPSCARLFRSAFTGQKFCAPACYRASLRRPIAPRFWAKVNQDGRVHPVLGTPCWPWTGARTGSSSRHGQVMWRARYRTPQKAHRIAWELTHGPIAADRQINHHCDNPICCNPAHLYLGSQADNMRDASARRRFSVPRTRNLSLVQRLTIYQTPWYRGIGVDLAQHYGVSRASIAFIRRGRFLGSGIWKGTAA